MLGFAHCRPATGCETLDKLTDFGPQPLERGDIDVEHVACGVILCRDVLPRATICCRYFAVLWGRMLRYHVAFYLPRTAGEMVVAEALDFPGAVTQGFDLPDARLMIASAMEDLAQLLLEEGKPLPTPSAEATARCQLDRARAAVRSCWASPSVKRYALINHLYREGCCLEREGGRHHLHKSGQWREGARAAPLRDR